MQRLDGAHGTTPLLEPWRPWVDPVGTPWEAPHGEMSGVSPWDPIKLRPKAKENMLRLLRPLLGQLPPLALRNELQSPSPMISEATLLSPPRC